MCVDLPLFFKTLRYLKQSWLTPMTLQKYGILDTYTGSQQIRITWCYQNSSCSKTFRVFRLQLPLWHRNTPGKGDELWHAEWQQWWFSPLISRAVSSALPSNRRYHPLNIFIWQVLLCSEDLKYVRKASTLDLYGKGERVLKSTGLSSSRSLWMQRGFCCWWHSVAAHFKWTQSVFETHPWIT